MRIVIDLQGAQGSSRDRGIGRYSLEFALAIVRNCKNHEIIIVLNGMLPETIEAIRHEFEGLLPAASIRVWNGVSPATGDRAEDQVRRNISKALREAFLESLQPDIVHLTSIFEGFSDNAVNTVPDNRSYLLSSTFYDLIPLNNPDTYLDSHQIYKKYYLDIVPDLMAVDLHLSISNYSSEELVESLCVPSDKVVNVYAGVDQKFRRIEDKLKHLASLREKFHITKPYLMYSGASDERKNHLRLIEAFSRSKFKSDYQLVIVGRMPPGNQQRFRLHGESCGLDEEQMIITNTVSDDELIALYNNCTLFVFPAWQEGFGLPLVEAMRCGAPVIGSNASSIPEVIDEPSALFDPLDVVSIRDAMDAALDDPAFLERMIRHGAERAAFFTWDRVGIRAVEAFEQAFHAGAMAARRQGDEATSANGRDSAHYRGAALDAVRAILWKQPAVPGSGPTVARSHQVPAISEAEVVTVARSISLNHPQRALNQLFLDVSELVNRDAKTGIQRVVRSVLSQLMLSPPPGYQIEPIYATIDQPGYRYARTFTNRMFGGLYTPLPDDIVDFKAGDIFLSVDLQHHVVLAQHDTYQSLRNVGVEVYFVVHDLLPVLMPEKFPEGAEVTHDQWLMEISSTDGLICVSRAVADELIEWLDEHGVNRHRPLKIGWFHHGADIDGSMPSRGASAGSSHSLDQLLQSTTFLMVGTLEPRKGYAQTLAAFEKLWEQGYEVNLVIVGKRGWNIESLVRCMERSREYGRRLLWLQSISDEYLEAVYAASDCLIAASEGEGFGLPLIEAARHGLFIFARALPVFREVTHESAFYFEGLEPDVMAKALTEWLALFERNEAPKMDDMPWQTWKQATAQLVDRILNNDWYKSWSGPKGWRYEASHPALHSAVGSRVGQELHTSGRAGHLLFGPYISMDAGRYRLRIYGCYDGNGEATYDLVSNQGRNLLKEGVIKAHPRWGAMLVVDFEALKDINNLEIRISVDGGVNMNISRIELFPLKSAKTSDEKRSSSAASA